MVIKPPTFVQRIAHRFGTALLSYAGLSQGASALPIERQSLVSKAVPGFAPRSPRTSLQVDPDLMATTRMLEALFGRISGGAGPVETRWSTFSGQLTPEAITSAIHQANLGQPFQFADMCDMVIEKDAHLGGVIEQRNSGIIGKPDRIEPSEHFQGDELAISIANYMTVVKGQIESWDDARFGLLFADGIGYAGAENVFDYRPISWMDSRGKKRKGIYLVPKTLEIVHPKHFTFDASTGEPLLWLQGGYVPLPPGKFVFHRAFGFSPLSERRGFMRSCIWLHAMKHWSLRDMTIYLHEYGLPQLIAEYDGKRMSHEEAKRLTDLLLRQWGQGKLVVSDEGLNIREAGTAPNGSLVHRDAAQFLNGEISKRVLYSNLTVDSSGGPGSYGLGGIHENAAFDGKLLSAMKLCTSIRRGVFQPTLELNAQVLAEELGASPSEILARLPWYTSRIERETGMERANIYALAGRIGVKTSAAQFRHDMHLNAPKDKDDEMGGEAVAVPAGGKVVSGAEASQGTSAPTPNPESIPEKPVSKQERMSPHVNASLS